jgi:hypothetical protein
VVVLQHIVEVVVLLAALRAQRLSSPRYRLQQVLELHLPPLVLLLAATVDVVLNSVTHCVTPMVHTVLVARKSDTVVWVCLLNSANTSIRSYGYCGNTDGHCLVANGCISGCKSATTTKAAPTSAALSSVASSRVDTAAPSSTTGEPVISAVSSSAGTAPTGTVTKDGTCGATNDNTVCGDWAQGSCCS